MELGDLWTAIVWGIVPGALFLLLVWTLDRYEKEPLRLLVIALVFGALAAPLLAFLVQKGLDVPTSIRAQSLIPEFQLSVVSPLIEEIARGLAVLAVFFLVRREIDDLYDGLLYGAIVGIGFAMAAGFASILATDAPSPVPGQDAAPGLFTAAVAGLNHLFYGAVIGLALGYARSAEAGRVLGLAALGTVAAFGFHLLHDYLPWWVAPEATGDTSAFGRILTNVPNFLGLVGLAVVAIWSTARQARIVANELRGEVEAGFVTSEEYSTVTDPQRRFVALARTLFREGDDAWRARRHLYAQQIELAFRKHHGAHGGVQASRGPDEDEYRRRIGAARTALGRSMEAAR